MLMELVVFRGCSSLWALPRWAIRDINTPRSGIRPRICGILPPSIKRDQFFFLNEGFTNRAFLGLGVKMEPFVKAWPTEEMPTKSNDGILS